MHIIRSANISYFFFNTAVLKVALLVVTYLQQLLAESEEICGIVFSNTTCTKLHLGSLQKDKELSSQVLICLKKEVG